MRMELSPHLENQQDNPLYIQLYQYIKAEIIANRITIDDELPSVRKLTAHLGVSKTTVESAYGQLLAEGYIYSKPQKGYFVSHLEGLDLNDLKHKSLGKGMNLPEPLCFDYDFKSEYVEVGNFNLTNWKQHLNHVINYEGEQLYSFGDIQGEETLRKAIVKYIHRTRGVNAHENNIIVGAGVQPLLQILGFLLKKQGISKIAMEDPGFNRAKNVFAHQEFEIVPLEVSDKGVHVEQLKDSSVRLCYVSPSHQFPTGTVMLMDVRTRLIKWAQENDGYIIEDDYNSELRYEGQPIPAMQGLDQHQHVIYLGSFSTVLIPTIRISFMLLPNPIMEVFLVDKEKYAQTASKLEQLALAHMMEVGDFEKHIRKIRKNYAKKSEYTLKLIEQHLGQYIDIMSINAGLNILLKLKSACDEKNLVMILKNEGINISSLSEYAIALRTEVPILNLNFRGIDKEKIEKGILRMARVLSTDCQ